MSKSKILRSATSNLSEGYACKCRTRLMSSGMSVSMNVSTAEPKATLTSKRVWICQCTRLMCIPKIMESSNQTQ